MTHQPAPVHVGLDELQGQLADGLAALADGVCGPVATAHADVLGRVDQVSCGLEDVFRNCLACGGRGHSR